MLLEGGKLEETPKAGYTVSFPQMKILEIKILDIGSSTRLLDLDIKTLQNDLL
jgi:hypothetical protein